MEYEKLKSKSVKKVLLRAKSGRGKTLTAARVALEVSRMGGEVLYVDTEAEGSTTMVALVEDKETDYEPEDVENIQYVRADSYTDLMENIHAQDGRHTEFDLIIVDTLDHKHSYVLKHITDAKRDAGAD
jgi:cellulose biosynthesis protein BcsQ